VTGNYSSLGTWSPVVSSRRLTFSRTEVGQLALAFLVLTVDMALISSRAPSMFPNVPTGSFLYYAYYALFGATAALTGFVAHELAHKFSAQRHGFPAEFRMYPVGLLVSLITAFLGFLFAAPGATVVGGMTDTREWGRTSLAGPLFNLVAGSAFLLAALGSWDLFGSIVSWKVLGQLAFFNGWFATFNLLPFGPLDGRKVLRWNWGYWIAFFALGIAITAFAYVQIFIDGAPGL